MMYDTGITAETAATPALAVDGPQPVWMTLNRAREQAFTGEIVFETDPEVFAYLDNGIVYYAERSSDVSLGRRLLDAGVVDIAQLERGTVRVGDIEHLGRLFDRDSSVDRDAVVVLAETATQDLIAELAKHSIAAVRFTAYRHHPSGVHRWFVAPLDPATMARPVSAVAQLDTTVVDELPGLPFDDGDIADLVIEWDDVIDETPGLHVDVFELSLELAEFTDDDADEAATPSDVEPIGALDVSDTGEPDGDGFEFSVVWPDGSEEPATEATAYVEESISSLDEPSDVDALDALDAELVALDAERDALDAERDALDALDAELDAVLAESDDNSLRFTMPPLELSDELERADAEVPDDVAQAVRRAIAAIESASVSEHEAASHRESTVQLGQIVDVEILDESAITEFTEPVPGVRAPDGTPATLTSFAPPTMATRAEVLYAQMEVDDTMVEATPTLDESSPSVGVASVVFAGDAAEDGFDAVNERSSALRRLIGSLRRKDH